MFLRSVTGYEIFRIENHHQSRISPELKPVTSFILSDISYRMENHPPPI